MSDSSWWIEIVFLAMLAGFIALRLVSVLGRRTDETPAGDAFQAPRPEIARPGPVIDLRPRPAFELPADLDPSLHAPLRAIAEADPRFDPASFVTGAKGAYKLILEAYWAGDQKAIDELVSDEVSEQFKGAIEARAADGVTLENRLVRIERAAITAASLKGMMAEVTVRFDADLALVTRDREGKLIGGSTSDAVPTHDVWTFSRNAGSPDPNWLLIETDEEQ